MDSTTDICKTLSLFIEVPVKSQEIEQSRINLRASVLPLFTIF